MSPRDVGLFLRSSRTDAAIARLRPAIGGPGAMQAVYEQRPDPWGSADPAYRYQRRKYESLVALLPAGRRFASALDLGCGLGLLTRLLAARADAVLGIDVASAAIEAARRSGGDWPTIRFEQGDAMALPASLHGRFDLVVLADMVYYLWPLDDQVLKRMATRVTQLLAPGGVCLLANHYFFAADPESRRSRRIETAFIWSPGLRVLARHRRPFYLVTLLTPAGPEPTAIN
jgi:SAM-dependent methyltransferase